MSNVRIANKLAQSVRVSVTGGDGKAVDIQLQPNGVSDPVNESKLTQHTRSMVAAGHLRLRPA
jgi:hypothetical protein